VAEDAAQQELALERALAEAESYKSQLAAAETHREAFRQISIATEATLKELRERSDSTAATFEVQINKAVADLEEARKELEERRQDSLSFVKEVEIARADLAAAVKAHADELAAAKEELTLATLEAKTLSEQSDNMKLEVQKYQQAARTANGNYERELQLHALAATELRKVENELDSFKLQYLSIEQRLTDISADTIRKEKQFEEERGSFRTQSEESKELVENLRRTNDLLHGQIQSYGAQLQRLQESRFQSLSATPVPTTSLTSSHSAGDGGDADADVASATLSASPSVFASSNTSSGSGSGGGLLSIASEDEILELRRTEVELREALGSMKRNGDIDKAKLSVAESNCSRYQALLASTQKSLDETRAELKRELDKRSVTHDEAEYARLIAEVQQGNIVRESNLTLRSEKEQVSYRIVSFPSLSFHILSYPILSHLILSYRIVLLRSTESTWYHMGIM